MKNYLSTGSAFLVIRLIVMMAVMPLYAFAYQAAPFSNTLSPDFITESSAQLHGAVNPGGMPDTEQWFEWGISGQNNKIYETTHYRMSAATTMVNTQFTLRGLAPNTQYFYRQVAENSRGKNVGNYTYFTTKPLDVPETPVVIVTTEDPDTITDTSAVLKGYIAPNTSTGVHWWFQWGLTRNLENETPHGGWGSTSGEAKTTLTKLTPGTVYFYRVVGQNADGYVYGATKVFVTLGTPPPQETPKDQNVPTPQASTDGTNRQVTTNGTAGSNLASNNTSGNNLPGSGSYRPGDIFGALFGNKNNANTSTNNNATSSNVNASAGSNQTAAAANTPFGTFWNILTGKKGVEVTVEKVGPSKVPAHTPVEYRITYVYRENDPATQASLKVTLPSDVVYIGDNTLNELLLEQDAGPERTYVLPIGNLANGSTRTISILGMTTGDANDGFPDARARIEYTDSAGNQKVVAAENPSGGAKTQTASASSSGGFSILPHSIFGWIFYILLLVGIIFGIRKAKAFYDKRKEELEEEERNDHENNGNGAPQWGEGQLPA